jgi:hypothetical protein
VNRASLANQSRASPFVNHVHQHRAMVTIVHRVRFSVDSSRISKPNWQHTMRAALVLPNANRVKSLNRANRFANPVPAPVVTVHSFRSVDSSLTSRKKLLPKFILTAAILAMKFPANHVNRFANRAIRANKKW